MSKPYRFHPEAEAEYYAAAEYLELHRDGYGELFVSIAEHLLGLISESPALFTDKGDGIRSCYMGQFRYNIVFMEREADIVILAFAHTSRKPGYWRKRIPHLLH